MWATSCRFICFFLSFPKISHLAREACDSDGSWCHTPSSIGAEETLYCCCEDTMSWCVVSRYIHVHCTFFSWWPVWTLMQLCTEQTQEYRNAERLGTSLPEGFVHVIIDVQKHTKSPQSSSWGWHWLKCALSNLQALTLWTSMVVFCGPPSVLIDYMYTVAMYMHSLLSSLGLLLLWFRR